MKWLYIILIVMTFSIFLNISSVQAIITTTIQLVDQDTENMEDIYLQQSNPGADHGNLDFLIVGEGGDGNLTTFIKFNITNQVPASGTVTSATLRFYIYQSPGNPDTENFSISGLSNQTWVETGDTYGDWKHGVVTLLDWNITGRNASYSGDILFDVTSWVQSRISASDGNISFIMNATDEDFVTQSRLNMYSKEFATVALRPYLNITYTQVANFDIISPTNKTYFNNLSIYFSVTNDTTISGLNYSLNGGPNISISNESLFHAFLGTNYLLVFANDSTTTHSANVSFTVDMACNSTFANDKVCGGKDGKYILNCTIEDGNNYDWSKQDVTLCQNACFNGACQTPIINCISYCNPASGQQICGGYQNKFALACTDEDNDGCYDWSGSNVTFCTFGCRDGQCLNGTSVCISGSTRCFGNNILTCRDVNNDSFLEWDETNFQQCQYECFENITSGIRGAYCEFGSGNFTVWYGVNSALKEIGVYTEIIFYTPRMKASLVFFIAIIFSIGSGMVIRSWRIMVSSALFVILAGTYMGWMPIYITVILVVLTGMLFFMSNRTGEDAE